MSRILKLLTAIPGLDLLYSYRARAFGFSSLPDSRCTRTVGYQYKGRAAGFIHATFLRTGTAEGYVVHGGSGLAAFTEPFACADITFARLQRPSLQHVRAPVTRTAHGSDPPRARSIERLSTTSWRGE